MARSLPQDHPAVVELNSVSKSYRMPGGTDLTVLEDVNLTVREGEFLALLGPSGSGKSTLLRMIAGLVPPSSGHVLLDGRTQPPGVRPGVAMVFQSFALFPWLTVLENVEIGLEARNITLEERRGRAIWVIDMIGLDGFEGAYPKELSGGMRQRVGFARALVVEPDLLLLDEAFSALDVLTAENLRRDLLELWIDKKIPTRAIIDVTHSIEEAVYMADRAAVIRGDPATIVAEVSIRLLHWRDKQDPAFLRQVDELYRILTHRGGDEAEEADETAVGQEEVPPVPAGALTGLIELLEEREGAVDLYRLGEELALDLEDLLPIVEAAQLLGLAVVSEGDISLTDLGRSFANATVIARKELFRDAALASVPALARIVHVLQQKANHKMPREFFQNVLERRHGREEAVHQLDILIDWGRYAEVLAYDDETRQIFLEEPELVDSVASIPEGNRGDVGEDPAGEEREVRENLDVKEPRT
jgi:NitT/TauT family transport system ATP-binding protein